MGRPPAPKQKKTHHSVITGLSAGGMILWISEITKSMFILDVNFPLSSFHRRKKNPSCSMHLHHCPTKTHTLRLPFFRGKKSKMCVPLCILQRRKDEGTLLRHISNLAELLKMMLCWEVCVFTVWAQCWLLPGYKEDQSEYLTMLAGCCQVVSGCCLWKIKGSILNYWLAVAWFQGCTSLEWLNHSQVEIMHSNWSDV